MKYIYEICENCDESANIGVQTFYCKTCKSVFSRTPSKEAVEFQKKYNGTVVPLTLGTFGIALAAFYFLKGTSYGIFVFLGILLLGISNLLYFIKKIEIKDRSVMYDTQILDFDGFKKYLDLELPKNIKMIAFYVVTSLIFSAVVYFLNWGLLVLSVILPLVLVLICIPLKSAIEAKKILGLKELP